MSWTICGGLLAGHLQWLMGRFLMEAVPWFVRSMLVYCPPRALGAVLLGAPHSPVEQCISVFWVGLERGFSLWQHPAGLGEPLLTHMFSLPSMGKSQAGRFLLVGSCVTWAGLMRLKLNCSLCPPQSIQSQICFAPQCAGSSLLDFLTGTSFSLVYNRGSFAGVGGGGWRW